MKKVEALFSFSLFRCSIVKSLFWFLRQSTYIYIDVCFYLEEERRAIVTFWCFSASSCTGQSQEKAMRRLPIRRLWSSLFSSLLFFSFHLSSLLLPLSLFFLEKRTRQSGGRRRKERLKTATDSWITRCRLYPYLPTRRSRLSSSSSFPLVSLFLFVLSFFP